MQTVTQAGAIAASRRRQKHRRKSGMGASLRREEALLKSPAPFLLHRCRQQMQGKQCRERTQRGLSQSRPSQKGGERPG